MGKAYTEYFVFETKSQCAMLVFSDNLNLFWWVKNALLYSLKTNILRC